MLAHWDASILHIPVFYVSARRGDADRQFHTARPALYSQNLPARACGRACVRLRRVTVHRPGSATSKSKAKAQREDPPMDARAATLLRTALQDLR